jgi:glutamate racemase
MPATMNDNPIGVFDSGLGGLTVVKELMRQLPEEEIVYFGDTARVPYGTKSKEAIIRFSIENTKVLLRHKVKMVVVACNSSTSYALKILRNQFHLPIIGVIKPGVRKALTTTRNGRVGVIATNATINSEAYEKEIHRQNSKIHVKGQACPLFVPLVEEGWFEKPVTFDVAKEYMSSLKKFGVDTLILGCTHYPLLKSVLTKAMGKSVVLVDSAQEVACEVVALLEAVNMKRLSKKKPCHKFIFSDKPQAFQKVAKNFLGHQFEPIMRSARCGN